VAGLAEGFEENAKHGDSILSSYIDTVDKSRKEPGFNPNDSSTCYSFIHEVLQSRMHLAQNHRLPVEMVEHAINPLAELFLRVEQLCLNDPATFGVYANYPTTYGWERINRSVRSGRTGSLYKEIKLSIPYRRIVTRFMDKLADQRETLHKDRRESLEELGRDLNMWEQRYPWPYLVNADFLEGFPWEEDAPVLLEYLKKVCSIHAIISWILTDGKIIYTNLSRFQGEEKDLTSGSWNSALCV
jgi:hypothetical protein